MTPSTSAQAPPTQVRWAAGTSIVSATMRLTAAWGDGRGRKAEPAMGMLGAQKFQIMGREIGHHEPPGGPQDPRGLLDRARAVVEEVQHLVDDDEIEGIPRQREIVDVALPHAAMA